MLEEFRELVRAGILRVTPENEVLSTKETATPNASAGKPLEASEEDVALLDRQLVEWFEQRRRQRGSEDPRRKAPAKPLGQLLGAISGGLQQKVVERLAQKILEAWSRSGDESEEYPALRDRVAELLTDEILRRWQSGSE